MQVTTLANILKDAKIVKKNSNEERTSNLYLKRSRSWPDHGDLKDMVRHGMVIWYSAFVVSDNILTNLLITLLLCSSDSNSAYVVTIRMHQRSARTTQMTQYIAGNWSFISQTYSLIFRGWFLNARENRMHTTEKSCSYVCCKKSRWRIWL